MNTPVSFKLAKLLKEKGFDKKCNSFYDLISNSQIDNAPLTNYNLTKQSVSIPTITQVVMWLYEKHGIWIKANWYNRNNDYIFWDYTIEKIANYPDPMDYTPTNTEDKNSPTEAYEAGIEYCLNNLI